MMRKFYLFLFFHCFLLTSGWSQNIETQPVYKQITFLENSNDVVDIRTVSKLFKEGKFNQPFGNKIYHQLKNKENVWLHIPIKPSSKEQYFLISNSYLHYAKAYIQTDNGLRELHQVSYNKNFPFKHIFYKHPSWKIEASKSSSDVFIHIKDLEQRTRLEMSLSNQNDFFKKMQLEYLGTGLFIALLCSLVLIMLAISLVQKQYAMLFYGLYILLIIVEFLAAKGIGIQYLWSDSPFLVSNIRSLSQVLATCSASCFFMLFYKYDSKTQIYKKIFQVSFIITGISLLFYAIKFLFGGMGSLYLWVWAVLRIVVFTFFVVHWLLIRKRILPSYLGVAFTLPVIGTLLHQFYNPSILLSDFIINSIHNIFYITVSIEIILVFYFIISEIVVGKLLSINLIQENLKLKNEFQEGIFEMQEKERNNLVNNVHDSFGGYIEALRLGLTNNSLDEKTINGLMDSFSKEYKVLLNTLYSPKLNYVNLELSLMEYCDKMNELSNIQILYQFKFEKHIKLSQEICVNIYRIITELITNAIKHAQTDVIHLLVATQNDELTLKVKDEGKGFDINQAAKNGFGTKSVQNRVHILNGELQIISDINKGTEVLIVIPLKTNEHE